MLGANALLLRRSLAPLEALTALMRRVDVLRPSDRLTDKGNGDLTDLIGAFNAMLDRLEAERTTASASRPGRAGERAAAHRQRAARRDRPEPDGGAADLKRAVDRAPGRAPRASCADTQETVRASLDEVRSIARRLRPDALEDLGLHSALTALCHRIHPRQPESAWSNTCTAV